MNNDRIYIVLTNTGTIFSKVIKLYTKDPFTHVSLSLDNNLEHMYSFGRKHAYLPFPGGFVHENTKWGTFKRFKNTKSKIIEFKVTNEQFEKIESLVGDINNHKGEYKYDILGTLLAALGKNHNRNHAYYCSSFVYHIMTESGINLDFDEVVKPNDFASIDGKTIFTGYLREYDVKNNTIIKNL